MPGPFCDFEARKPHRLEKVDEERVRCTLCGEELTRDQLAALVKAGQLAREYEGSACKRFDGPASTERPKRAGDAPPPGAVPRKRPPPVV